MAAFARLTHTLCPDNSRSSFHLRNDDLSVLGDFRSSILDRDHWLLDLMSRRFYVSEQLLGSLSKHSDPFRLEETTVSQSLQVGWILPDPIKEELSIQLVDDGYR